MVYRVTKCYDLPNTELNPLSIEFLISKERPRPLFLITASGTAFKERILYFIHIFVCSDESQWLNKAIVETGSYNTKPVIG
jgi:hypothetical protein